MFSFDCDRNIMFLSIGKELIEYFPDKISQSQEKDYRRVLLLLETQVLVSFTGRNNDGTNLILFG